MTDSARSLVEAAREARDARTSGQVDRAISIYLQLGDSSRSRKAVAIAAQGLMDCGRWTEAVGILNRGLKENPLSVSLLTRLAHAHVLVENYTSAAEYLTRAVARDPLAPQPWLALAEVQILARQWNGAIESCSRALALAPENSLAALGLGDAFYGLERFQDAVAAYRRALAIAPGDGPSLIRLGGALLQTDELDEAEVALRRGIDLGVTNALPLANLAAVLHRRGECEAAERVCRKAVELDPALGDAYLTLGLALLDQGRAADAVTNLRKGLEIDPLSREGLLSLATAERLLGNISTAEPALHRILATAPGDPEARHLLAALHGEPLRTVSADYVAALFDRLAPGFDRYVTARLRNRTPECIHDMLCDEGVHIGSRYLDLGCGTGRMCQSLRRGHTFSATVGIDISARMLDVARARGGFDRLFEGDAAEVMASLGEQFDLITAADLAPYLGQLPGFMSAVERALTPRGVLAFSIETGPGADFRLMGTGRFSHAVAYISDLTRPTSLRVRGIRLEVLAQEWGRPIAGALIVLERTEK